jgi:two-component system response regulator AtoC
VVTRGGVRPTVLVVDDEPGVRASVKVVLAPEYEVIEAADGLAALETVRTREVNLCLLDILLPGMEGIEVLERLRRLDPGLPVVLVTAVRTLRTAVEAMRLGAADYLTKPFSVEDLRAVVQRALERRALQREVWYLRDELARHEGFDELIGGSAAMRRVYESTRTVSGARPVSACGAPNGWPEALTPLHPANAAHLEAAFGPLTRQNPTAYSPAIPRR